MKTSIVDSFTKLLFYAGSILFVCLIAVLFVSVISRYCLGHSFSWSEEVYSFLFIWVSYIGVILAMENDSHLRVDTLLMYLPPFTRRVFDVANMIVVIAFCLVMSWFGTELVMNTMELGQYAVTVPVSIALISTVIPLSFLVMSLYGLRNLVRLLKTPVNETHANK